MSSAGIPLGSTSITSSQLIGNQSTSTSKANETGGFSGVSSTQVGAHDNNAKTGAGKTSETADAFMSRINATYEFDRPSKSERALEFCKDIGTGLLKGIGKGLKWLGIGIGVAAMSPVILGCGIAKGVGMMIDAYQGHKQAKQDEHNAKANVHDAAYLKVQDDLDAAKFNGHAKASTEEYKLVLTPKKFQEQFKYINETHKRLETIKEDLENSAYSQSAYAGDTLDDQVKSLYSMSNVKQDDKNDGIQPRDFYQMMNDTDNVKKSKITGDDGNFANTIAGENSVDDNEVDKIINEMSFEADDMVKMSDALADPSRTKGTEDPKNVAKEDFNPLEGMTLEDIVDMDEVDLKLNMLKQI